LERAYTDERRSFEGKEDRAKEIAFAKTDHEIVPLIG
jgi:hypothetical protein